MRPAKKDLRQQRVLCKNGFQSKMDAKGVAAVGVGSAVVGVATPLVAGAVVSSAGFGTGGVLAGTWAAGFMASYGGVVSAGSACALFQSIGAAGLGYGGTALLAGAGAVVAVPLLAGGYLGYTYIKS